jgi:hypothetical protein
MEDLNQQPVAPPAVRCIRAVVRCAAPRRQAGDGFSGSISTSELSWQLP